MRDAPSSHVADQPLEKLARRGRIDAAVDRLIPCPFRFHRERILYLVVGGWNTLFGYAAFAVLFRLVGGEVGPAVVITTSYVIAILNAYLGYRYVVFRSRGTIGHELPRFASVYVLTLIVNLAFYPLALRLLPSSPYLVQGLFTVGVVVVSYLVHSTFSFRPAHPARRQEQAGDATSQCAGRESTDQSPIARGQ